jgi:hypothetical protein
MVTLLVCLIVALALLVRWLAYLRFLRWLVEKTGRSESLRDAGQAASGFNAHLPRLEVRELPRSAGDRHLDENEHPGNDEERDLFIEGQGTGDDSNDVQELRDS